MSKSVDFIPNALSKISRNEETLTELQKLLTYSMEGDIATQNILKFGAIKTIVSSFIQNPLNKEAQIKKYCLLLILSCKNDSFNPNELSVLSFLPSNIIVSDCKALTDFIDEMKSLYATEKNQLSVSCCSTIIIRVASFLLTPTKNKMSSLTSISVPSASPSSSPSSASIASACPPPASSKSAASSSKDLRKKVLNEKQELLESLQSLSRTGCMIIASKVLMETYLHLSDTKSLDPLAIFTESLKSLKGCGKSGLELLAENTLREVKDGTFFQISKEEPKDDEGSSDSGNGSSSGDDDRK